MTSIETIDWRQDKEFQAVQRKLSELSTRATQIEQRAAELKERIAEGEQDRIRIRANILLGEATDSDAESLVESLARYRQELEDLEGERAATQLAMTKLQATLKQAETAAKQRVATQLGPRYREAVASLQETLNLAVEANDAVHQLYRHIAKQDLLGALVSDPLQKVLLKPAGLNFLSAPDGRRSLELREWDKAIAHIVEG